MDQTLSLTVSGLILPVDRLLWITVGLRRYPREGISTGGSNECVLNVE